MTLTKPILIFTLLSSVFISCQPNNEVYTYLEKKNVGMAYHSIIILTEMGCPTCNSSLANSITSHTFDSTLIVVNALGTIIDLTDIQQNQLKNTLVYDYQEQYQELGINGSGIIVLNKKLEVDSIIKIDARQLTQQLEFLQSLSNK